MRVWQIVSAVTVGGAGRSSTFCGTCLSRVRVARGAVVGRSRAPRVLSGPPSPTLPRHPRRALVMQWQVWTAFGIRLSYVADLAHFLVGDGGGGIKGLRLAADAGKRHAAYRDGGPACVWVPRVAALIHGARPA